MNFVIIALLFINNKFSTPTENNLNLAKATDFNIVTLMLGPAQKELQLAVAIESPSWEEPAEQVQPGVVITRTTIKKPKTRISTRILCSMFLNNWIGAIMFYGLVPVNLTLVEIKPINEVCTTSWPISYHFSTQLVNPVRVIAPNGVFSESIGLVNIDAISSDPSNFTSLLLESERCKKLFKVPKEITGFTQKTSELVIRNKAIFIVVFLLSMWVDFCHLSMLSLKTKV